MRCNKCKKEIIIDDLGFEGIQGVLGGVKVRLCYNCGIEIKRFIEGENK